MATRILGVTGQTTITGKNQVSLPAKTMKELGWGRGDRLIVEIAGEDVLVLVKRPDHWAEEFAGRLTDVFSNHEENVLWLEREREAWHSEEPGDSENAR